MCSILFTVECTPTVFVFHLDELPLSDAYGMPLSQAVKLVSVLCAASRSIASKLVYSRKLHNTPTHH